METRLWVVCGAGRGVGKSHLARELCTLLPGAEYAKKGCGRAQEGKGGNYFTSQEELDRFIAAATGRATHLVVESNSTARAGRGDLVIYLEPLPGHTQVREDADRLAERAHISIGERVDPAEWDPHLARLLADPELRGRVRTLLSEQRSRSLEIGLAVRSKLWFIKDDLRVFGPGLANILEAVEREGTLRRAVERVKISYRHAWSVIKGAEDHLGLKLVEPQVGGSGGGGSTLSGEGRKLLAIFREVSLEVAEFADKCFAERLARTWGGGRS